MKVAYWTEESACTQFSTPVLIIFQHRWKEGGKNTDLFVSWETMRAFETWRKIQKRGTRGGQLWENKVSLVLLFSAFEANLKFLVVDLLTSLFLSEVLFLTPTQSWLHQSPRHDSCQWIITCNKNWLFSYFTGFWTWIYLFIVQCTKDNSRRRTSST